jgi:peptide deformylase
MTILNLVHCDDPILREEMPEFDFANPPTDPIQLSKDLTETMIQNKGLGLAANQCGLRYRVFVLTGEQVLACFNPRVVSASAETTYLDEGCLSYPGLMVKIKRPQTIRVRFTMPNGDTTTRMFDGITARCFLHELDHLNGKLHISRANPYHLEKALKMQKAYNRIMKKDINGKIAKIAAAYEKALQEEDKKKSA